MRAGDIHSVNIGHGSLISNKRYCNFGIPRNIWSDIEDGGECDDRRACALPRRRFGNENCERRPRIFGGSERRDDRVGPSLEVVRRESGGRKF